MRTRKQSFRISDLQWARREFDPAAPEDLAEYRHFIEHDQWRDGCPFYLEWPFLTVPSMIEHRIVSYHISSLINAKKARFKLK